MSIACRCADAGTLSVMSRLAVISWVVLLAAFAAGAQEHLKFMGRDVTVVDQGSEKDGFTFKGPASVCLEGAPRQCYTMPAEFVRNPRVEVVDIEPGSPALLFSAESYGASGWLVHFALLRPGAARGLEDLFVFDASTSNQNQHAFWTESGMSDAKMFVTAEVVWGPEEAHYGPHRYVISSYLAVPAYSPVGALYYLWDRYMTVAKYDLDTDDILAAEKQEILARLARVKQASSGVR